MQIIYHGHSFVEIETEKGSILIDPFITGNPKCDISLEDIFSKSITHILLTHGHSDHVGDTVDIAKHFPTAKIVTIYGLAKYLINQWVSQCEWFGIWGTYYAWDFSVKFVSAIHDGGILDTWLSTQPSWLIIKIWDRTIYHAGDTSVTKDMELLSHYNIDLAFLPIGWTYTMDLTDAVVAASMIKSATIVPIHYNTRTKIKADDIEFARQIMLGQYAVPKVLRPGQYIVL